MYEAYNHDEYSQAQMRGLGCSFWALWALGTASAATLGQFGAQTLIRALLHDDTPSIYVLVLAAAPVGILMGALIGVAQGLLIGRHLGPGGFKHWVIASAIGGLLRWTVIGPLGYLLLSMMDVGIGVCNILIPLFLYGVVAGGVFGVPQAVVLKRHLGQATEMDDAAWVVANAAGGILSLPFVMLSGLTPAAVTAMVGLVNDSQYGAVLAAVAINWLAAGIISGLPLRDRLRAARLRSYRS
jgi:hypothetical protein